MSGVGTDQRCWPPANNSAVEDDRKLGVNEAIATSAATIHFFTGNNIGPRGDLASRSLQIRLEVDRPDPENREFKHSDPIDWTDAKRGQILAALYTILLGNPRRDPNNKHLGLRQTRFKEWWDLVGSAIEHAAKLAKKQSREEKINQRVADADEPPPVSFKDLFLTQEQEMKKAPRSPMRSLSSNKNGRRVRLGWRQHSRQLMLPSLRIPPENGRPKPTVCTPRPCVTSYFRRSPLQIRR